MSARLSQRAGVIPVRSVSLRHATDDTAARNGLRTHHPRTQLLTINASPTMSVYPSTRTQRAERSRQSDTLHVIVRRPLLPMRHAGHESRIGRVAPLSSLCVRPLHPGRGLSCLRLHVSLSTGTSVTAGHGWLLLRESSVRFPPRFGGRRRCRDTAIGESVGKSHQVFPKSRVGTGHLATFRAYRLAVTPQPHHSNRVLKVGATTLRLGGSCWLALNEQFRAFPADRLPILTGWRRPQ